MDIKRPKEKTKNLDGAIMVDMSCQPKSATSQRGLSVPFSADW